MSFGRYGADNPGERKVSLEITVDKWVSDALGKIRSKKSVSNLVNSLLGTVIRQFDPGPSAPMVYDLVALLAKHRRRAEEAGDDEALAAISQLHSELEPYIDLAEAEPLPAPEEGKGPQNTGTPPLKRGWSPAFGPPAPAGGRRDYHWYVVPVLCHGIPMEYLRGPKAWSCSVCRRLIPDR